MAEATTRTASFKPRARLVSILGEHMISDHVVGLLELVKNSYDADAGNVEVAIDGMNSPETTRIAVRDDGFGMTAHDVVEKFLSPAVDHKSNDKKHDRRTPKGRLPIGEKGVGRFAVQQLGRHLLLATRAARQPEVVVEIAWDEFDRPDTFLQDLTFPITEREPEVFTGEQTGTLIVMSNARVPWNETSVRKVQRGLRRLQSPHIEEGKQDFKVALSCPQHPELQSLDAGDILDHAHYTFRALVDENGLMLYEYHARHPGVKERKREAEADIGASSKGDLSGPGPVCGPFYINLYVWDRSATYLQASGINRADLDAMAGVSLFRDHLRVLPYGEPGDDWLRLDRDRINDPSARIGNNQVIGFVEVSQSNTPDLRDKTNREGLIDNAAFRDLQTLVRAATAFFNTLYVQDRPAVKKPAPVETMPVKTRLEQAHSVATAIGSSARSDVRVDLPIPPAPSPSEAGQNGVSASSESDSNGSPDATAPVGPASLFNIPPVESVTQQEASNRLIQTIEQAITSERLEESEQHAQRDTLLHLAATGMAAERVVHEVGRQVGAALGAIEAVRGGGTTGQKALDVLEAALGTMRNEFRALAPFEGVSRFQKSAPIELREAADIALLLNQAVVEAEGVEVVFEGESFRVQARPASVIQVFDNLLHNALAWVSHGGREKRITVGFDADARTVVIGDSGPGVPVEVAPMVFEPFVSTRPGGRGLGLYISRALMEADGGRISVLTDESCTVAQGANFLLDFSGYRRPDTG